MSNWELLNKSRLKHGVYASHQSDGFNGCFELKINGLLVRIIASDGGGWQHVSVTIKESIFPPSWSIMTAVKDLFWEEEDWVVQYHPAKSEYVNNHPGCLHLWRSTDQPMPTPPTWMVGIKDLDKLFIMQ